MTIELPNQINSNIQGYNHLSELFNKSQKVKKENVIIDFSKISFLDGNLSAVLGAIITGMRENLNNVSLVNIQTQVEKILLKNRFLEFYNGRSVHDNYNTTVQFKKFSVVEGTQFKNYIDKELLTMSGMPQMTINLRNRINRSVLEIFNNASIHGQTDYIFSCGQFYPTLKKLDFTIVDLGHTIRHNVRNYLKEPTKSGVESVLWAIQEGHTTKTGNIPGGLGLSLIREFLQLNEGKLQIASSDGYYEECKGEKITEKLNFAFVGTIVNIEFNLNDDKSYSLVEEVDINNLF